MDFLRGGLNIEVISEAGDLGHSPPEGTGCFSNMYNTKIMPNARFRAYLSIYKEVLNQIWSRGCGGCNPLEDIGCFYLIKY